MRLLTTSSLHKRLCFRTVVSGSGHLRSRLPLPSFSMLGVVQHLIQRGAIEVFAFQPDGLDVGGVVNIGKWIGIEQDQIGAFAGSDGADVRGAAEKDRWIEGGRLKRREGR